MPAPRQSTSTRGRSARERCTWWATGRTSSPNWRSVRPRSGLPLPGGGSERLVPRALGGSTGRVLLIVDDPPGVQARAISAGATEKSPVDHEHGWLVGRILDPYGHEWEIGKPLTVWPPSVAEQGTGATH